MAERLRVRSPDIYRAILDRLQGMEEGAPTRDVEYLRGLREAVARGVEYGIALLEEGAARDPQVPVALTAQGRLAARQGIPLEMVIRRYFAGKTLLGDFIFGELTALDIQNPVLLRNAMAIQGAAFDRLLAMVTEEYRREEPSRNGAGGSQLAGQVHRLLAGELVDPSCLDYDLDRHHLGVVAGSADARQVIRLLATETNSRLLMISAAGGETWAWLGRREPFKAEAVSRFAAGISSPSLPIGLGEPARSCSGWRLTHRQAREAFSIAQASPAGLARYAEVALILSGAKDPVLTASLQELYLSPLREERDGGQVLRDTLRAYFSADRNSASAASTLKVSRQTVANRLQTVEDRVGQPLSICASAVDAALRLEELGFLDSR